MATKPKLDADLSGKLIDQIDYYSKIGSLMYLTSSRLDIVQAFLGDKLVSWMSKKKDCIAMSSAKAEYVALSASCAQLSDFNVPKDKGECLSFSVRLSLREEKSSIMISYTLSWKPCQGDSLNLPDHRYKRRCCSLISAEFDSLPHAHAQTTKTYYKHQDSRIKKAQEFKT
ncbi:hypothetical protein Tco_0573083 [Tanacetum coccineum]